MKKQYITRHVHGTSTGERLRIGLLLFRHLPPPQVIPPTNDVWRYQYTLNCHNVEFEYDQLIEHDRHHIDRHRVEVGITAGEKKSCPVCSYC